ncbi:MAG: CPBP family intramembrane metalloprotease [Proteiniphilum sp.]|nr:CPBP family intramembrane metalloprotease [Proteiniphilum sp.]
MQPILTSASSGTRIAILFLFLLTGLILSAGMIAWIGLFSGPGEGGRLTMIYAGTAVQSIFVLAAPATLLALLTEKRPAHYLKLAGNKMMAGQIVLVWMVYLFSYPLASFLSQLNKQMVLPESFHEIEAAMRSMEDAAMETTELLLSVDTAGGLLLNLLVVALLAAVTEELFFRGALQQLLRNWFGSGHGSVWASAGIFSLVHFQFYGFLPRMLLGALLGYLFLYTANLWIPILFHFINNATVILFHYFWGDARWFNSLDDQPLTLSFLAAALAGALFTFLLFRFYRRRSPLPAQQAHKFL